MYINKVYICLTLIGSIYSLFGSRALAAEEVFIDRCGLRRAGDDACLYSFLLKGQDRVAPFVAFSLPAFFRKDMLRESVEALAREYGTAYRNIGITEDWDHGHLLVSRSDGRARAIVFHTQEALPVRLPLAMETEAQYRDLVRSLYAPGGLLADLDRTKRSWIYFFDTRRLHLAEDFKLDTRPAGIEEQVWQSWIAHHTYTTFNLDPVKLGFGFREHGGFTFHRAQCSFSAEARDPDNNLLYISTPHSENTCLYLRYSPSDL